MSCPAGQGPWIAFTPHVHWHVIARFRDDAHFPQSIWGAHQRAVPTPSANSAALPQRLATRLKHVLATRPNH